MGDQVPPGERPAVTATRPETGAGGAGNPAFREQMERGVTAAALCVPVGLSRAESGVIYPRSPVPSLGLGPEPNKHMLVE